MEFLGIPDKKFETLARHLKEKSSLGCPSCGADDWSVVDIVDLPVSGKPRETIPAVSLCCDNCFFLSFYSAAKIEIA